MVIDVLFLGGISVDLIQNRQKEGMGLVFSASIGGSIANSAIILAKLGLKTGLVSKVGKDSLGIFVKESLDSLKIDTNGIIQDPNIHTPLAIAKIDKSGVAKYTFYKNSPKDSVVPIKNTPKILLDTCKIFHSGSSYSYQKETFEETLKFVKYLKRRGVFISYDPNIRPSSITDKASIKNRVSKLLKMADLAKLSEIDLEYLTGQKNPAKGLKQLKKQVNCELILTLGAKGSAYYSSMSLRGREVPEATEDEMSEGVPSPPGEANLIKVPAFKVKIADTIGAGDAFTAGLIYQLIKQGRAKFLSNMRHNMIFASAVSAIICTKKGSHQGLKNLKQVNSFLLRRSNNFTNRQCQNVKLLSGNSLSS